MWPIKIMCDVLNVSTSGYYDALVSEPSARAARHDQIRHAVRQVYDEHHAIYGSWKIADVLRQAELFRPRVRLPGSKRKSVVK